ncbi:unnamed protein product [Cuscuta campestris]|uniref:Uncharacterized protein n=1 Tax=Cuscuta campestris TaxID=132261 RepID=A0A484LAG0_9ASTE|nr:unnamed protein product [Cuscuta campestris]
MDREESEYLFGGGDQKPHRRNHHHNQQDTDEVVPEQKKSCTALVPRPIDGIPAYEIDFASGKSKQPFMYHFASQSISHRRSHDGARVNNLNLDSLQVKSGGKLQR